MTKGEINKHEPDDIRSELGSKFDEKRRDKTKLIDHLMMEVNG
jgi:hypothetical protein